ncbi:M20 family metallopeptidase [Anaerorhabdus sp.]|uniref:M20 family metallopeptidase n=1 Tax=Anaerorhabdus sp. TaxID=1872524 RepID=UPI002FC7B62A
MKDELKKLSDIEVENRMDELWNLSRYIHENPELCFKEEKACKAQCDFLRKEGFSVKEGLGSLPTAFEASIGEGKPVVAILSEYDALAIGHACGHNLISISAMGAAIGIKKTLENEKFEGTLKIIGTPAEESGGGKIILLKEGFFEEVDAVIMMHPTSFTSRLAGECLSSKKISIEYLGQSAHAGSHPDNGINALSAANLYFVATGMLRQHFKGDARLSGIIVDGGLQTGLVPERSEIRGSLSCFSLNDLNRYAEMIVHAAEGCGEAMGCKCNVKIEDGYEGRIPNKILSDVCKEELIAINEPLMDGMPIDFGGEDLGNISRHIPICNPYITIFPEYKISNHTEQFKQLAISDAGRRCLEVSSKSMARTALELLYNPKIIEDAKTELKERLEHE